MTLPKSLAGWFAVLVVFWLTGCSVQKRTTAPGWHVEKAPSLFHQAGPTSSLTHDAKSEPQALTRMNRIPPRALDWTTRQADVDTSAVDAKVKRQVKRALRAEIQHREAILMFPRGLTRGSNERQADKWHEKAVQRCEARGLHLNELAPDEFARLESLRYPGRETMQELKSRKTLIVVAASIVYILLIQFFLFIFLMGGVWNGGW